MKSINVTAEIEFATLAVRGFRRLQELSLPEMCREGLSDDAIDEIREAYSFMDIVQKQIDRETPINQVVQ